MKQLGPARLRCSTAAERTMVNHHLRLAARARAVNEVILVEFWVEANGRVRMIGLALQESAFAWRYSFVWHGDALLRPNDPSSAIRRTGRRDCNYGAHAGFAGGSPPVVRPVVYVERRRTHVRHSGYLHTS